MFVAFALVAIDIVPPNKLLFESDSETEKALVDPVFEIVRLVRPLKDAVVEFIGITVEPIVIEPVADAVIPVSPAPFPTNEPAVIVPDAVRLDKPDKDDALTLPLIEALPGIDTSPEESACILTFPAPSEINIELSK